MIIKNNLPKIVSREGICAVLGHPKKSLNETYTLQFSLTVSDKGGGRVESIPQQFLPFTWKSLDVSYLKLHEFVQLFVADAPGPDGVKTMPVLKGLKRSLQDTFMFLH